MRERERERERERVTHSNCQVTIAHRMPAGTREKEEDVVEEISQSLQEQSECRDAGFSLCSSLHKNSTKRAI